MGALRCIRWQRCQTDAPSLLRHRARGGSWPLASLQLARCCSLLEWPGAATDPVKPRKGSCGGSTGAGGGALGQRALELSVTNGGVAGRRAV